MIEHLAAPWVAHLIVPMPPKLSLSMKIWGDSSLYTLQEIEFHHHQGCMSFALYR